MAAKKVAVEAWECLCENPKCPQRPYRWISLAKELPAACPVCKSRAWNGPKTIGRPKGGRDTSKLALPKPKRVRPT